MQQVGQTGFARREAEPFVYQSTLTFGFPRPLPISAVFRLRYVCRLVQKRAAQGVTGRSLPVAGRIGRCNGNWGTWGFERQIG